LVNASLKLSTDSSPPSYFQVRVTTFLRPLSAMTLPIGWAGCQLAGDVRKTLGAHCPPVAALAPALGIRSSVFVSRATLTMAITTPE
jgi:hypothetical protein